MNGPLQLAAEGGETRSVPVLLPFQGCTKHEVNRDDVKPLVTTAVFATRETKFFFPLSIISGFSTLE